ncbi:MAG: oxidative damage protection protein [Gammaproteobacteria bacterium]
MTRHVFCQKYHAQLEGLERPPFPGPSGQAIYEHVSKDAWQAWLKHQTLLINEKHLSLMAPETQAYLAEQRERFLTNQSYDHADGYVAPPQSSQQSSQQSSNQSADTPTDTTK